MISKQDILERAREWGLRPEVVEKDYVLGWLLTAVALNDDIAATWILKGGTCVKKCHFETYRFSEDLDFSLLPEAEYSEEAIAATLRELAETCTDLSGIEFDLASLAVRKRLDKLERRTFEGKLGYKGPLAVPGWPRILFDITQHEPIIDEPVLRAILHPYPDGPLPVDALVSTYSMEELIAEKTRALYERSRPRDLYDVVYILTNSADAIALAHARDVFADKCIAKQLAVPSADDIVRVVGEAPELVSEWTNMLEHQLPSLPTVDGILERLPGALAWLRRVGDYGVEKVAPSVPALVPVASGTGEVPLAREPFTLWRAGAPLETVRFAAANRLLVQFVYSGKLRTVEPYSLRKSNPGNILLYAWETESGRIKAFDVKKMTVLKAMTRTFVPRYKIELSSSGTIASDILIPERTPVRGVRRSSRRTSSGPVHVFRCPACNKEFRHKTSDPTLRRHRMSSDGPYCSSRRGSLERFV